jgi:integrase
MPVKLTKTIIDDVKPQDKEQLIFDSQISGFGLRVSPGGRKSFILQYRFRRRSRRLTIGRYGHMTLEQARSRAVKSLALVEDGVDPAYEKQAGKTAPVMNDLCDRFWDEHVMVRLKPRTAEGYKRVLNKFVRPVLGEIRVRDIKRADIADLHHRMRTTPYDANRMLEVVSKMFNLAEMWGWRDEHSNPRRHIAKYPERKRERYLSRDELARLLGTLEYAEGILDGKILEGHEEQKPLIVHRSAINALRLLMFTGCRLREIQTLKWSYVDWENRALRLPDTKTGARVVPVSRHVIDLLTAIWSHKDTPQENEYVIYGTLPLAHLTDLQPPWQRIRKAAGLEDVRIHDLRHSFASYAVSAGHSLPMIGKLLGHTQVQTTARYAHLMTDPMHKAADDIVGNMLSHRE